MAAAAATATALSALSALSHPSASSASPTLSLSLSLSLGHSADFNASALLALREQFQLQVIAATFSSASIVAAMCALLWFCMMRRNFRRDLVLLLIIGDFWKSTWFLVFSVTSLATGHVATASHFCQATGYFLQLGLEACDCAILLMSLHMMLQIFPPAHSRLGGDGLYRIRYFVLVVWLVVPSATTSLAFTNSGPAFISQAGFCSLPIRPIWYRLALSWIPRYLIWTFVMAVAIRIYSHVGYEFRVFGQEQDESSSVAIPDHSPGATSNVATMRSVATQSDAATVEKLAAPDDGLALHEDTLLPLMPNHPRWTGWDTLPRADTSRRRSMPNWPSPGAHPAAGPSDSPPPGPLPFASRSTPASRRGSRQTSAGNGTDAADFAAMPIELVGPPGSLSTLASRRSGDEQSAQEPNPSGLTLIAEHATAATAQRAPDNIASRAMQGRRKAIQRQLRLLFIYPVMYLLLWIFPFVSHTLNYSNHYAQHPIFALSVTNTFCQNIMGFSDVCIFCWREKPWRHIPGSDGTFLGSLLFWRYCFSRQWTDQRPRGTALAEPHSPEHSSQKGFLGSIKRWSTSITGQSSVQRPSNDSATAPAQNPRRAKPPIHRRTRSGGSDRRTLQAEHARERLARERADYELHWRSLQDQRTSVAESPRPTLLERKEWWDRHLSVGGGDGSGDDATMVTASS